MSQRFSPPIHEGSEIVLNGMAYRISLLRDLTLRPQHAPFPQEHIDAIERSLPHLEQLAQRVTAINESLIDVHQGLIGRALSQVVQSTRVESAFRTLIAPYLFAVLKYGCNVIAERGSVIVPPAPRVEFERHLALVDLPDIDWPSVLDAMFDPIPRVTQGFYRFETPEDWDHFERQLGSDYHDRCSALRALFDRALAPQSMQGADWTQLDHLSQAVMESQRQRIEAALQESSSDCRQPATRVMVRCDAQGRLTCEAHHYSEVFRTELDQCADLLSLAAQTIPTTAAELRGVLADLVAWCRDQSGDESWFLSRPAWIAASDPHGLIDVNLTFEEKVSRVGAKGGMQLLVCAHDSVPAAFEPVLDKVREQGRENNINTIFFRQLIVGGGASNYTIAGEKLPDPAGQPKYKVMTFTNTTRTALVSSNKELIECAIGWPSDQMERLANAAPLLVLFHEFGHTLGDHVEFLGDLAGSVEETNAEASAIYQTQRLAPDLLDCALAFIGCWTPVRRALQGPTEPHSHANIVLFHEFLSAGTLCVQHNDARFVVQVSNANALIAKAFDIAIQMRLWEAAIPIAQHAQFAEPYDPTDPDQDTRIAQRVRSWLQSQSPSTLTAMRRTVLEECRAFFALDRLHEISAPLQQIISTLPTFQPMSLVVSDQRFHTVVAQALV